MSEVIFSVKTVVGWFVVVECTYFVNLVHVPVTCEKQIKVDR